MIQFLRAIIGAASTRTRLATLEGRFEDLRSSLADNRLDDIRRSIRLKPTLDPVDFSGFNPACHLSWLDAFRPASWRGLTFFEPRSGAAGISFDTDDGETVRLQLRPHDISAIYAATGQLLSQQPKAPDPRSGRPDQSASSRRQA